MLNVVEVADEGFEAGAENALGLEARGVLAGLPAAAVRASAFVAPGFDDDGLYRRDLDDLARAQQLACGLRQLGAAAVAGGGAARDDHVRVLPLAAAAFMAGVWATPRVRLAVGAIGLAGPGGGRRGVRGVLRRLGEALDLVFKRFDTGQQLLDEGLLLKDGGLLPENDLDQFGFGQLLQLLTCHRGDPRVW